MMGQVALENGKEAVFFLTESDIEVLDQEVAEARILDNKTSYSIADELAYGITSWVKRLSEIQGRKEETPEAATPRESV